MNANDIQCLFAILYRSKFIQTARHMFYPFSSKNGENRGKNPSTIQFAGFFFVWCETENKQKIIGRELYVFVSEVSICRISVLLILQLWWELIKFYYCFQSVARV